MAERSELLTTLPNENAMDTAKTRIAEEQKRRTGSLDLSDLGLDSFPEELLSLKLLQSLDCGDNRIADLTPLAHLPSLQSLNCAFNQIADLTPLAHLPSLQSLNCAFNQIADLTPLAHLPSLQSLDCAFNQIADLTPLAHLPSLQSLNCAFHQIADLTPLAHLPSLQSLNCGSNQIADLTPLAHLPSLQSLDCAFNQIADLTPLAHLPSLQSLDCGSNRIADLTPLAHLTSLQSLNCGSNQIADLADLTPLAHLTSLQSLDCWSNQITDLTPLAHLTSLQSLNCGDNRIADLTPLAHLTSLQSLNCAFNQIADLTPLAHLPSLQSLDCKFNQIADLTPLAQLTSLQSLDCRSNQIADLTPLAHLASLQSLNCWSNQIADLTPLAHLPSLQSLDCSDCHLQALPASIYQDLPSLRKLKLLGNTIPGIPSEILQQDDELSGCLAALRAHFADLSSEPDVLPDIRLLLLGNGGVGKTQIARWLAGADFDSNWNSTHGILLTAKPLAETLAAKLHLQIWDFGGQDIYHGTHALFLKNPAILMPVWATEKENSKEYELDGITFRNYPLSYWIEILRQQANPHSPVLIAQTQCDNWEQQEQIFPIPAGALQGLPIYRQLWLSAKERRGQGALEEALQDAIAWLRNPSRLGLPQIGAGRLRVQRRLEAMSEMDQALPLKERKHRWIDRTFFETLCAEAGDISSTEHLLDYLDANGTVMYRKGSFGGRIVLDKAWALEAIYAIFDRKQVYRVLCNPSQKGRFTRSLLASLVWQDKTLGEQKLLLEMMQSCGMCFPHKKFRNDDDGNEDKEYIAPDLLPARAAEGETLAQHWDNDLPCETVVFRYELLHGGLIRSVMSEIGEKAGASALYWRGGLSGFDKRTGSKLLIEEEITGQWQGNIRVRTQGGEAATLLQWATELVEKMQDRIGLRPFETQRSSPAEKNTPAKEPEFVAAKPTKRTPRMQKWYVSYAWGDDKTPEGIIRETKVNELCSNAKAAQKIILRDKDILKRGDSITSFMRALGAGDRIFIVMSNKYLESVDCMFELNEIWRNSKLDEKLFNKKVQILALPGTRLFDKTDPIHWAKYWKQRYLDLDAEPSDVRGAYGDELLRKMRNYYLQTSDVLGTIIQYVQARRIDDLSFD